MDTYWQAQFRDRMASFARGSQSAGLAVSIKIRATAGCFHRSCCPSAYRDIDALWSHRDSEVFRLEEHESGPEILTWVQYAAAGVTLSAAVINLVAAIIKARSDGIKRGDRHHEPVELIVRGIEKGDEYFEETVLRVATGEELPAAKVESLLKEVLSKRRSATTTRRKKTKRKKAKTT